MKQSPTDLKQYQSLTLDNGLRVLLVHNSESNKSAAALAVNVGHFSDPVDRQGLAHFLEHMLFLGTKKYPDGSEYQQFISQYGGTNNAWTATEHTCFFFDIHHLHFAEALDRFSQFFSAPLLSEEFVNKERKNIDAEFKLKLKDDIRRLYDVHKETINPAHPFAKFSVGNTETLADKADSCLRSEVANFFTQYYVAKAMTLVLEGPQSLSELAQFAHEYFSPLSTKAIQYPLPDIPLYLQEHQQIALQVKPVKNDHQLIVSFALPSIDQYYREKPESLLSYLIGHEGPNSILSLLKSKHWALGLTAGAGINGYNFKDFNISIRLTESGEQHIDDIIDIIFAYLALLKQQPLPGHYYQEKKALAQLSFQYHEKMKPLDSVCQLVINMQHYPPEDYIFGDYAMDGCQHSIIEKLLAKFTPDNMRYVVISQDVETDKVSRWYQVPYQVTAIASEKIKRWQTINKVPSLALPPVNEFIVAKPEVYSANIDSSDQELLPQSITQNSGFTLWFKQDISFKIPKGYIYIGIDSPETLKSSRHIAMTRLFVDLYTDAVIEQHYDAELAGIHYHLYAHQGGLTLQLSGVSTKQEMLLSQLLTELQSFVFAEDKFILLKYQLINHWQNADNSKSISQLFSSLSAIMQPKAPNSDVLANALETVSYMEFKHFCQQIFQAISLDVLIHGNWRHQDARQLEAIIEQAFTGQYHQDNKVHTEAINIKNKGNIKIPLHLPEHDYAAVLYYPMQDREPSTVAKTMITSQILSPLFFQVMRTEQQYGYLVGVGFVPINRYPGLAFYIQSPKYQASELTSAMDEFINGCHSALAQMSAQDWQHLQHGLTSQLQENDTSLRVRSQRFWAAICNQETDFKQKQRLIESILSLTKEDISDFIQQSLTNLDKEQDRFELMSVKQAVAAKANTKTLINDDDLANFLKTCSIKR